MIETIHSFGRNKGLVGTITYPSESNNEKSLPVMILWNAGLIHRVGPYRLNVDLARKIASMGFTVFRFDMSRKGDSDKGDATKPWMQLSSENLNDAMDFLYKETGVNSFILVGFCSGADQLHPVALSDQRVSGAVFLDGCGYRTIRYHLNVLKTFPGRILRIAFNPAKLKKSLKSRFDGMVSKPDVEMTEDVYLVRFFPPKKQAELDILKMLGRGMNLLYVYTGGVQHYYNYRTQFRDMFSFNTKKYKNNLQFEFFEFANHTYAITEDRSKLINLIADWAHIHYVKA